MNQIRITSWVLNVEGKEDIGYKAIDTPVQIVKMNYIKYIYVKFVNLSEKKIVSAHISSS